MIKEYGGLNSTRKGKGGDKSLGKGLSLRAYCQRNIIILFLNILARIIILS
jgi:hypothetical protein